MRPLHDLLLEHDHLQTRGIGSSTDFLITAGLVQTPRRRLSGRRVEMQPPIAEHPGVDFKRPSTARPNPWRWKRILTRIRLICPTVWDTCRSAPIATSSPSINADQELASGTAERPLARGC
jgi:hypothetical protein